MVTARYCYSPKISKLSSRSLAFPLSYKIQSSLVMTPCAYSFSILKKQLQRLRWRPRSQVQYNESPLSKLEFSGNKEKSVPPNSMFTSF